MTGSGGFGGYAPFKFGSVRPEPLREYIPGSRELIDQVLQGLSPGRVIESYLESKVYLGGLRMQGPHSPEFTIQGEGSAWFLSIQGGMFSGPPSTRYNSLEKLLAQLADMVDWEDWDDKSKKALLGLNHGKPLAEGYLEGNLGVAVTDNTKELYLSATQPDIDELYHAVEMSAREMPAVQFKAVEPGEMAGERRVWVRSEEMGDLQTLIHELREKGVSFTVGEVRREQRP